MSDQRLRPDPVTASATLAAVVGGGTLFGLVYLAIPLFDHSGTPSFTAIASALAVVQVSAGVLLLTGARRFATGAGRAGLVAGCALEFPVCAVYGWYAVAAVAGDPEDSGVFPVFFGVPCAAAVATAVCLSLALRPSLPSRPWRT